MHLTTLMQSAILADLRTRPEIRDGKPGFVAFLRGASHTDILFHESETTAAKEATLRAMREFTWCRLARRWVKR